jgi:MFS family permease
VFRRLAGRHATLLRKSKSFRLLFLATLGSGLGTRLAVVALIVDVYDRTHSGKWVGALLVADFLPTIAIGLLLGSLVDRLPRRALMIGSDLVRLMAFCALPFAGSAAVVVALAGVVGFANGFFRPAVYAGLPNLVDDADLPDANGLLQTIENVAWAVGPLIGGVLLSISGPDAAYWVNAVTFLFSALLITRIPNRLLQSAQALSEGHWRDLAEGFRLARRSRPLATVLVVWTIVMVMLAHVDVAEVTLAKVAFDAGNFGLGVMMAAAGVGLAAGSLIAGTLAERRATSTVYAGSIAVMALAIFAAAIAPNVWVAVACLVGFGVGNGVALVANSLLVQRGAPDHLRGRAFTLVMSVNYSALLIAMLVAGAVTDAFGARWAWVIASMAGGAAALIAVPMTRGADVRAAPGGPTPLPVEVGVSTAPAPDARAVGD